MTLGEGQTDEPCECKICAKEVGGPAALVEHLRFGHAILELAIFSCLTMLQEERRNSAAKGLHRVVAQNFGK